MISRTIFCSAQAAVMRRARKGTMPSTSRIRSGSASKARGHRPKAEARVSAFFARNVRQIGT
jgi:hypothetical protein